MNGSPAAVSPRDWVGDEPFPWPPVLAAADGDDVVACFTITRMDVGRTRNDAAFLKLQLADCYGTVDARMWDGVDDVVDALRPGVYVGVRGRIERYQEERQLRIEQLAVLAVELDDLVLFLPRSARGAEHMDAELTALIASVRDVPLRALLNRLLAAESETGHAFRLAPAAKQNHHAYLGGLIEHTLSMARLCDMFATHYGAVLDRDLLITAALLHDIGKIREIGARAGFPYTDEGKLLGHIVLGMQMVADAARDIDGIGAQRLLLLQHLIASHQGRYEWQSPREPRTLEALVLHYADDIDAKVSQVGSLLNAVPAGWSAYDRSLARDFYRHMPAEGVARAPAPPPATRARKVTPPEPPAAPPEPPAPDTLDLFGG
ncbi:MAG TPA: HD domain-containing protein [Longimicrobiales bacterium]|nr:HD domain-containing protein [Longimicrobiales bacterium]